MIGTVVMVVYVAFGASAVTINILLSLIFGSELVVIWVRTGMRLSKTSCV